jgi:ribosomal protein S18 acetylase RimI-like enzyme
MTIRQATLEDIDQLAVLFAQYRSFYEQPFEPEAAKQFLEERLSSGESVVFIALENETQTGFTQLYPSFSSVGMQRIWILNDLFVAGEHRKKGIARSLINQVMAYSKATGRKKVVLSTAYTNTSAQKLYERIGFVREDYYNYEMPA